MICWRICRKKYASEPLDGEGAKLNTGRWNRKGVAMAYCAEHLSLAVLELLCHAAGGDQPTDYHAVKVEVPDNLITTFYDPMMPIGRSRAYGSKWANGNSSVALRVPSVVIPSDYNVLINPNHPDHGKVKVLIRGELHLDERLFLPTVDVIVENKSFPSALVLP